MKNEIKVTFTMEELAMAWVAVERYAESFEENSEKYNMGYAISDKIFDAMHLYRAAVRFEESQK